MSHFPYHFFEKYVVRTPMLSHKNFKERISKNEISDQELKEICFNPVFQEAIYLASPNLYEELYQWLHSKKQLSEKQNQKLINTILKYYSRMSTRCTPFGLFSGVGLGEFTNDERSDLFNLEKTRDTKLDMHFLVALSQWFVKIDNIRNRLLFSPNNSIYKIGDKIRYIEYEYVEGKRDYIVSSAPASKELESVLDFSKQGKTLGQIVDVLVNEEITAHDAKEFIEELIDNQVLVSELEPNVSGYDFLNTIISVLNRIGETSKSDTLITIRHKLGQLDQYIGNPVSLYSEIESLIKSFNIEYEQKYLFQTDLYVKNEFNLNTVWKKEIKKGISFLNKITPVNKDTYLEKFKKAFYERFETQEVPLAYALDTEIGIGYQQDITAKGVHPYLEDLALPINKEKPSVNIKLNPAQVIVNQRLQETLLDGSFAIQLTDEDFNAFEENWDDLPDTLSFMTEIVSEEGKQKLVLESGGGKSGANLLARFCSEKSGIRNLVKTIADKEQELNPDYILAEIIHLPEARIGNVIRRPTLRNYEIPYLSQSLLPSENQILIDDLYISIKNDRIILRSQKLDKEVKPCLTNAHNYSASSLPVYHFLCDLHSQNNSTGLYFNWGDLKRIYQFLPRVEYKNIILSKALWKITEREFARFSILTNDETDNKEQLLSEIRIWRNKRKIPQWIQWVQSDNKLPINLENYNLVKIFIDTIKTLKSIIIEEFLYNDNNDYMCQFVFSMYNEKTEDSRTKSR